MRFLFTAAPHDHIKHLRVSSTPSANAETPKKQHSGGGNLVGEGRSFFLCEIGYFQLLCMADKHRFYDLRWTRNSCLRYTKSLSGVLVVFLEGDVLISSAKWRVREV